MARLSRPLLAFFLVGLLSLGVVVHGEHSGRFVLLVSVDGQSRRKLAATS